MGRYLGPKCKLCRREGMKLFLKGAKCNSPSCAFSRRPHPPGERKRSGVKPSYYALQLREKQKVKRMYGLLERQFKRYFRLAHSSRGITGKVLLQLLERRLDNVVFRLLFAHSRNQARQIVCHGFIYVNGRRVNIPSYLVKVDDKIEVKAKGSIRKMIEENIENISSVRSVSSWLFLDRENLCGEVIRLPEKEDLAVPVNEQLIVEFYSK